MRVLGSAAAVLFLFLLLPPSTSGQMNLGFQGGLSMATIGGSDAGDDIGYKTGLGLGALLEIPISEMMSIQPEISYMQKGAKDSEEEVDIKIHFNYIEVPLLLKIKIPTDGNIAPYFVVGPALGLKTGCKISGDEGGVSIDVDCDEFGADIKSTDLGGVIGAGLAVPRGPGQILISARYNIGFTTLDDSSGEYEEDVKNRAFSLLAGYSFPVGG